MKACTVCKMISSKVHCPSCGNPTSDNWSGLLIITDPEESELARELNIDEIKEIGGLNCFIYEIITNK
mgnify:CR=1 FL=1